MFSNLIALEIAEDIYTYVRKYEDGPMIGPSSQYSQPMLVIDIGPMIDRGLDDNCGPIWTCYIGSKIAPDYRPRITARVKPPIFPIYNDINNDNKI